MLQFCMICLLSQVTVQPKQLNGRVANQPSSATVGVAFDLEADLLDSVTGQRLDDVNWKVRVLHFINFYVKLSLCVFVILIL